MASTDDDLAAPSADERARWLRHPRRQVRLEYLWDGRLAPRDGPVVSFGFETSGLVVAVDAPFHDDPAPSTAAGSCHGLWDHEVVELFLLGSGDRYFELELGPHGHYLALCLRGARSVVRHGMPVAYRSQLEGTRWSGRARVPLEWLPPGLNRFNAYAIDGPAERRRHWAYRPGRDGAPDFHRLDTFARL